MDRKASVTTQTSFDEATPRENEEKTVEFKEKNISEQQVEDVISAVKKEGRLNLRFSSCVILQNFWLELKSELERLERPEVKEMEFINTPLEVGSCSSFVDIMKVCSTHRIMLSRCKVTAEWLAEFVKTLSNKDPENNKLQIVEILNDDELKVKLAEDDLKALLTRCGVQNLRLDLFKLKRTKDGKIHLRPTNRPLKPEGWSSIVDIADKYSVQQINICVQQTGGNRLQDLRVALQNASRQKLCVIPRLEITSLAPLPQINNILHLLRFISESIELKGPLLSSDSFYFQLREILQIHAPKSLVVAAGDSIVIKIDRQEYNERRGKILRADVLRAEHETSNVQQTCEILDFSYSPFTSENVPLLGDMLKKFVSLQSFIFRGCGLEGKSVQDIVRVVASNKSQVKKIDLSYNPDIGEIGAKAIAEMLASTQVEAIIVVGCDIEKWHEKVMMPALMAAEKRPAGCTITYNSDFLSVNIRKSGGSITFERSGCHMAFPAQAIKKATQVNFRIKAPDSLFPQGTLPVTPIVECLPSGSDFKVPVSVKLPTWIVPKTPVTLKILTRESSEHEWVVESKVTHEGGEFVQFEMSHFSEEVGCVEEGEAGQCRYKYIYMLFMPAQPPIYGSEQKLISVFVPDNSSTVQNALQKYKSRGFTEYSVDQPLCIDKESTICLSFKTDGQDIKIVPENREIKGEEIIRHSGKNTGFTLSHGVVPDNTGETSYTLSHVLECDDKVDFDENITLKWGPQTFTPTPTPINVFYIEKAIFREGNRQAIFNAPVSTENLITSPESVSITSSNDSETQQSQDTSVIITRTVVPPDQDFQNNRKRSLDDSEDEQSTSRKKPAMKEIFRGEEPTTSTDGD